MAPAEVETLLRDLSAQAEAEKKKLLADARSRIAEIRSRADAQVSRIEEEADRRLERQVALDRDRAMGAFRLEQRRRRLEIRRSWLQRAFALARERLEEKTRGPSYHETLARLARAAAEAVGGDADLEVARADVEACRKLAATVRERGETAGTVVAVSPDGLRRADNSLAARLEQASRLMEDEASDLLFGGPK